MHTKSRTNGTSRAGTSEHVSTFRRSHMNKRKEDEAVDLTLEHNSLDLFLIMIREAYTYNGAEVDRL
jgi:hypothetical protein